MLLRHRAVPIGLEDGADFGESGLELEFDRLLVSIASLRQQSMAFLREAAASQFISNGRYEWADQLVNEAEMLEGALDNWTKRLPQSWMPRQVSLPSGITPEPAHFFFSSEVIVYNNVTHASTWLHYFATKMLLVRTHLKILLGVCRDADESAGKEAICRACQGSTQKQCRDELKNLTSSLISTLPFALGQITSAAARVSDDLNTRDIELVADAEIKPYHVHLVFWPLSLAVGIDGLDLDQKRWLQSTISLLGCIIGAGVCESIDDFDGVGL
jgi:hypothetical protein